MIGTAKGVVRARTIRRLVDEDRWDGMMMLKVRGSVRRPHPRRDSDSVPIQIEDDGESTIDIEGDDTKKSDDIEMDCQIELKFQWSGTYPDRKQLHKSTMIYE